MMNETIRTKEEMVNCYHGLYRVYWKKKAGGGYSLASVGSTEDGTRWFACTNWILHDVPYLIRHFKQIKKMKLIERR